MSAQLTNEALFIRLRMLRDQIIFSGVITFLGDSSRSFIDIPVISGSHMHTGKQFV